MNDKLKIIHSIPEGFLRVKPKEITSVVDQPSIIHLKGKKKSALFLSILLHGNEISGLSVLQRVLKRYHNRILPRDLIIFIGNPQAAALGERHLKDQPDFNRIWNRSGLVRDLTAKSLMAYIKKQNIYAAIDIHNNSGRNPVYSCINSKSEDFIKLAQSFSKNIVYFTQPDSVLSMALSHFCPSVVIECGLPGSSYGITSAARFVQNILDKNEQWKKRNLRTKFIYRTYARLYIDPASSLSFHPRPALQRKVSKKGHVCLIDQFDKLNFKKLEEGQVLGKVSGPVKMKLINHKGVDIFDQVFSLAGKNLIVKSPFIPSMFTKNIDIARSDCLGYVMSKIKAEYIKSS